MYKQSWPPKNRPMEYVVMFEDGSYFRLDSCTGYGVKVNSLRNATIFTIARLANMADYFRKYIGPDTPYTMPGMEQAYKVRVLSDEICGLDPKDM